VVLNKNANDFKFYTTEGSEFRGPVNDFLEYLDANTAKNDKRTITRQLNSHYSIDT